MICLPAQDSGALIRREIGQIATAVMRDLDCTESDPDDFARSREDVGSHLLCLADAIEIASPDVFRQYVQWARLAMRPCDGDDASIVRSLQLIPNAIRDLVPDAALIAAQYVNDALSELKQPLSEPLCEIHEGEPHAEVAQRYLKALLDRDRVHAISVLAEARLPLRQIFLHVLTPALREVGRLWQIGQIGVDLEHYCTNATRDFMSKLGMDVLRAPASKFTILGAGVSQELHEVGLRMVCDLFDYEGWRSVYIGVNTPTVAIIEAVLREQPDVLALSATSPFYLYRVTDIIQRVRQLNSRTRILVGGHAFNTLPGLWKKVNADGYAPDGDAAVKLAKQLVTA